MVDGNLGVADPGGRRAGTPRFAGTAQAASGSRTGLLGSLEAVAMQLVEPLPLERTAAIAARAASRALDARVLVIAVPDETGEQLRALHVSGLPDDAAANLSTILDEAQAVVERRGQPARPLPRATSLTAVPIPLTRRRGGVLLLGRPPDRQLTREEHAYLRILTTLLGLALRRMRRDRPAGPQLRVGDLEIDLGDQRVVAGDRDARLTPSEIRLLLYLAEEPGRPRTRREILRHLWRTEHVVDERACDVHISNLRRKIERDPSHPQRLVTVRAVGYALQPM